MEYFEKLLKSGMVHEYWRPILSTLKDELCSQSNENFCMNNKTSHALTIFATYFSLIDDGNVYISRDPDEINKKFSKKISDMKIQADEDEKDSSLLDEISSDFKDALACLDDIDKITFVDKEKGLFVSEKNKIFTRKFFNAKNTVLERFEVLFKANVSKPCPFDYKKYVVDDFGLSPEQEEVIEKGFYNNLLITGGPGTGKTTSLFFLLLPLIINNPEAPVYLCAPSGKAASRMKESILKCKELLGNSKSAAGHDEEYESALTKIEELKEFTINRLLGTDYEDGGFRRNKNNQFESGSIFVIDEASMIDLPLFASLLEAIPDDARVYILGDKDQLPPVGVGSVYAELLEKADDDNCISLVKSQRFPENSEIFKLAQAVNAGAPEDMPLPVSESDWMDAVDFKIEDDDAARKNPIYYYSDDFGSFSGKTGLQKESAMMEHVCGSWYKKYYAGLQGVCKNISRPNSIDGRLDDNSEEVFKKIFGYLDDSRILSANNVGVRGVTSINQMLLKKYFTQDEKISGYYPGEPLMITENLYPLDLHNGDSGVAVTFALDETIYIMFKKNTTLTVNDEYVPNQIFALGDYVFYPARLVGRDYITTAFAITIHKSQGSDYRNILVILPRTTGHPLLNRQIVYTGITRTKGMTYILSNQENLEHASKTFLTRDTM